MTIAERIKQEGRTEGKLEGKLEGRMEGRMVLIHKLLNKRFGKISPTLEEKLQNSKLDILDKFGESLFDFNDLKDAENWWEAQGKEGNA